MRNLDLTKELLISLGMHLILVGLVVLMGVSASNDKTSFKKEEVTYIRAMSPALTKKGKEVNRASSPKKNKKINSKPTKNTKPVQKQTKKKPPNIKKPQKKVSATKTTAKSINVQKKQSTMAPERRLEPQVTETPVASKPTKPAVDRAQRPATSAWQRVQGSHRQGLQEVAHL